MRPNRNSDTGDRVERGQATVEFALVLPLVALLVVGLVEVARVTALQVATVDAARAGARAAAVDPRLSVARQAVGGFGEEVSIEVTAGSPSSVTVRVTRTVPVLPGLGWSAVHLHASSTMAVEEPG